MQELDILHTMNSLVKKVNALAVVMNTTEYNGETEEEYQELSQRLIELEEQYPEYISENSPTKRGGGKINDGVHIREHHDKIDHPSIAFEHSTILTYINEVDKTYIDNPETQIYTSPKLRLSYNILGIMVLLHYVNGVLERAVTVGDGLRGEVISDNARTILNLPHLLKDSGLGQPESLTIIGVVTMSKYTLERVNSMLVTDGYAPLLNCATAAASALRQHDSTITAARNLLFYARDIIEIKPGDIVAEMVTQSQVNEYLEDIGFDVVHGRTNNGVDDIVVSSDIFNVMTDMVKHGTLLIPYEFDGIIISPELTVIKDEMYLKHNGAVAFMFPDLSINTGLLGINWVMDIYGYYQPFAVVNIDGEVTTGRIASVKELLRMGLSDKSIIKIHRNKEGVVRVVDALPDFNEVKTLYTPPHVCPGCNSPLLTIPNLEVKCTNPNCNTLISRRLKHFKDSLGLDTITDDMLEYMYTNKIVTKPEDIFDHKLNSKLVDWNNGYISENHVGLIIKQINSHRNISVSKLIFSLGIEYVQERSSKLLARYFPSIKSFLLLETGNLNNIPGLTKGAIASVKNYLADTKNRETLVELDKYLTVNDEYALISNNLYNTSWVILGELDNLSSVLQTINMHGGNITKTITGSTTHILVGKSPPTDKLGIANVNNLPILDLSELLTMVG